MEAEEGKAYGTEGLSSQAAGRFFGTGGPDMKNTMEYKGYLGSVEFDEEEGLLFGRVMGIRSLISYEGESAKELLEDFHGAVDDYLELCRAEGKRRRRPTRGASTSASRRNCTSSWPSMRWNTMSPSTTAWSRRWKRRWRRNNRNAHIVLSAPGALGVDFLCKRGGLLKSASTGWFCLLSAAGAQGILLP